MKIIVTLESLNGNKVKAFVHIMGVLSLPLILNADSMRHYM